MSISRPWVILGNPENRRVSLFQQALASRGLSPAAALSYHGLLTGWESIEGIPPHAIVRVESPGENFAVEKLLLAAGSDAAQAEGSPFIAGRQLRDLGEDRGRILYPRQWYLGYLSSCARWFEAIAARPDCKLTSSHRDLQIIFDKAHCGRACSAAGLPVPAALGTVAGWDDLIERVRQCARERVFAKLSHGSSASGVAALYFHRGAVEAITTVEIVRAAAEIRLYNSLKIRRYTSIDQVRDLIDALAPHGLHVEEWLPKAAIGRRVFDLRILVVAGQPQQRVVRTSRTPLTNLHLGNRRGLLSDFLSRVSESAVASLHETCIGCWQVFSDSLHVGLDILFTPGLRRHYLLEVNAFGDLLPGIMHEGRNSYQTEIDLAGEF
jgi:hypothetical protein